MFISKLLSRETPEYYEEDIEESAEHRALEERLCKSLYYGQLPRTERPSKPLTELAVEYFRDAAPRQLGRVDMDFASSFGRKAFVSPCSLMLGMIYAQRLKQHGNADYLQQISSTDLFIISMLIASKYLYDEGTEEEVFNDEWAEAAGMDTDEINQLERQFLQETGWKLFMDEKEFADVLRRIEMTIAFRKGIERNGHFTYTDLHILSDLELRKALAAYFTEIGKVVVVCSVAYVACVAIMAITPLALSLATSCIEQATHHSIEVYRTDENNQSSSHSFHMDSTADCDNNNDAFIHPPSALSVIKAPLSPELLLPFGQSHNVNPLNTDLSCEFGLCRNGQLTAASYCLNVTIEITTCKTVPCCCCQYHAKYDTTRTPQSFQTTSFAH